MRKRTVMSLIAAVSMSCLLGCGGGTTTSDNAAATEKVSEESVTDTKEGTEKEEEKKEEKAEPVSETFELGDMVLVDNEEIKVVAKSIEIFDAAQEKVYKRKYDTVINVFVENKTDEGLVFIGGAYVNGLKTYASWIFEENSGGNAVEIAGGESADTRIELSDSAIRKQGYNPTDIVIEFESALDNKVIFESVHIYPYGEENVVRYEYELEDTDVVVVDNENVRVILNESWRYAEENYIDISYVIENKSDHDIYFTINKETIGDVSGLSWLYFDESVIKAKTTDSKSLNIDAMAIEDANVGIDFNEISEISYDLWILNADTFTSKTYDDIEWEWRMNGNDSAFNAEAYALGKASVTVEIADFQYE